MVCKGEKDKVVSMLAFALVNSFLKKKDAVNATEFLPFILLTSSTVIIVIGMVDALCWGDECKWTLIMSHNVVAGVVRAFVVLVVVLLLRQWR